MGSPRLQSPHPRGNIAKRPHTHKAHDREEVEFTQKNILAFSLAPPRKLTNGMDDPLRRSPILDPFLDLGSSGLSNGIVRVASLDMAAAQNLMALTPRILVVQIAMTSMSIQSLPCTDRRRRRRLNFWRFNF